MEMRLLRELTAERATVTRLQADIIHLHQILAAERGSRSQTTILECPSELAVEARLRWIEQQLLERSLSRSCSHSSRHERHSSMSQAIIVLGARAMMPPPAPVDVPLADGTYTEKVGTSTPAGTQGDDTLAS